MSLATSRTNTVRWEVLTLASAPAGSLAVEHGTGTLRESIYTNTRMVGTCRSIETDHDWHRLLVRPIITIDGIEHVAGTLLASVSTIATTATRRTVPIDLFDRSLILRQSKTPQSYAVPAGAVITDRVAAILRDVIGEPRWSVTDSPATLAAPMVWEPLTPWLRIINDLLDAANYFSLWADEYGTFTARPYVPPQERPESFDFTDGPAGIYLPEFARELDTFEVPNRVTMVARPVNDETPALVGTAVNSDPSSPFSRPSRGYWIDAGESNVEAASAAILQALAARRLAEASTVAGKVIFTHAWEPIPLHAAGRFTNARTGLVARGTITERETRLATAILTKTTLREHA